MELQIYIWKVQSQCVLFAMPFFTLEFALAKVVCSLCVGSFCVRQQQSNRLGILLCGGGSKKEKRLENCFASTITKSTVEMTIHSREN